MVILAFCFSKILFFCLLYFNRSVDDRVKPCSSGLNHLMALHSQMGLYWIFLFCCHSELHLMSASQRGQWLNLMTKHFTWQQLHLMALVKGKEEPDELVWGGQRRLLWCVDPPGSLRPEDNRMMNFSGSLIGMDDCTQHTNEKIKH